MRHCGLTRPARDPARASRGRDLRFARKGVKGMEKQVSQDERGRASCFDRDRESGGVRTPHRVASVVLLLAAGMLACGDDGNAAVTRETQSQNPAPDPSTGSMTPA